MNHPNLLLTMLILLNMCVAIIIVHTLRRCWKRFGQLRQEPLGKRWAVWYILNNVSMVLSLWAIDLLRMLDQTILHELRIFN